VRFAKTAKFKTARRVMTALVVSALIILNSQPSCRGEASGTTAIAWGEPKFFGTAVPISVKQALDETLMVSPRAASIRSQLGIAKAAIQDATVMPNPILNIDNGYVAEQTYIVSASIPIEPPWKIVLRLLTAKRQITETELEIGRNLWLLRADVRRAYAELAVAQETATTLIDLADLAMRLENIALNRYNAGDAADLDVQKAILATQQATIDRQQGLTRVVQAKQQLNVLLGRDFNHNIAVPQLPMTFQLHAVKTDLLPDFDHPLPPAQRLIDHAMESRLDIKALSQSIKANQMGLNNAIGNILPTPVFTFGHSTTGNPPTGPKLHGYHITANLETPILDRQQGNIARFKATIKSLRAQLAAQKNTAIGEVCDAYQKLVIAREKIRVYQERVLEQSSKVARMGRLSYEAGQSDITSALMAQQANIQVRNQYLDAVLDYQQAFTDLEQAVNEPLW